MSDCWQKNRPVTAKLQTGPINEVIEYAGEDMSHMQIDTGQNDTHSIGSKCALIPMKIDW